MSGKREIARWWTDHPMTYGAVHGAATYDDGAYTPGTPAFFDRVDREFYEWNRPLHDARPFGRLFPYNDFVGERVLEIGCGMGTMAMNWARAGARVTAVDLNPVAVERTRQRFAQLDLEGAICRADGGALPFDDGAFAYAYSWGVLHHSPSLEHSLAEMMRVIAPGGGFGLMLYNRRSLYHWYWTEYVEGFLHRERVFLSPLELASRYGDGGREEGNPHTWPVTRAEIAAYLAPYADDVSIRVLGTDLDYVFTFLLPGLGKVLPRIVRKVWARRFGWSLWVSGRKRPMGL